ncbi:MAG: alpha-L-arabinofuranosidase, partial [Candidatus Cryptobacteroides sp.]
DLNPMIAERPVMRHWDFSGHRQPKSMLVNGVDCSVRTAMFYLSKMFKDNPIDTYYDSVVCGIDGMRKVFATMGKDSATGEYVLKLINLMPERVSLCTDVKGFSRRVKAEKCLLALEGGKNNTPDDKDAVCPVKSLETLDFSYGIDLAPLSLTIYRFK